MSIHSPWPPAAAFVVQAADFHTHLVSALSRLVAACNGLDAAIDGATDQFDAERHALRRAIDAADTLLRRLNRARKAKPEGGRS
jgi:hypothetical protein